MPKEQKKEETKKPAKPKPEPKSDPLMITQSADLGTTSRMPSLSPQAITLPKSPEAIRAAQLLNAGMRRIDNLDREIAILNAAKSDVYRELKAAGLNPKRVREQISENRIDPIVRQQRDFERTVYRAAIEVGQVLENDAE